MWLSSSRAVELFESSGHRVLESSSVPLLEENASPFIGEADGLTSKREGVCLLLSLVAHAGGYGMMVGAHKNCWMLDAQGRSHRLCLGMVDVGTYIYCRCLEACEEFHHVHSVR